MRVRTCVLQPPSAWQSGVTAQACVREHEFVHTRLLTRLIFRAIADIAVYSKQRRIERIAKDDESSIRSALVIAQ